MATKRVGVRRGESGERQHHVEAWLSEADMMRVFDVTSRNGFAQVQRVFPSSAMRKSKDGYEFYARKCIDAWALSIAGDDATSALDRYREVKAAREQLKLDKDRSDLVEIETVRGVWDFISAGLKRTAERAQVRFGREAFELWSEFAEDCAQEIARVRSDLVAPSGRTGSDHSGGVAADLARPEGLRDARDASGERAGGGPAV